MIQSTNDNIFHSIFHSKVLSLENMKNMSTDEVINLYRQGYILEGQDASLEQDVVIQSLGVANPSVTSAIGYFSGSSGKIFVLWKNGGTYGYVKLAIGPYGTTTVLNYSEDCVQTKGGLSYRTDLNLSSSISTAFVKAYGCNSDSEQNCTSKTCTNQIFKSQLSGGAYIYSVYDTTVPPAPINLTATSISPYLLKFSWNIPSGVTIPPLLGYYLELRDPSNTIIESGYFPDIGSLNYTFGTYGGTLTGGTIYTFNIYAISVWGINSTTATTTGTTIAPSLGSITISSTDTVVNIGSTIQFSAICKDPTDVIVTCPILTWASSNPSIATIDTTGLVTGMAAGTVSITASSSGITSNIIYVVVFQNTGDLCIMTTPVGGASITIDGIPTGKVTALEGSSCTSQNIINNLTAGDHTWKLTLSGYQDAVSPPGSPITISAGVLNMLHWPLIGTIQSVINWYIGKIPTCNQWDYIHSTIQQAVTDVNYVGDIGTAELAVRNAYPTNIPCSLGSIIISPTTATIGIGGTQQLTAICKDPTNTTVTCPSLTWVSSNPTVAVVNSTGLVTGITSGTTNITASSSGIMSNVSTIIVSTTAPVLRSIIVSPPNPTVAIGYVQHFSAVCKDQYNNPISCPALTWTVSDPTKGSISNVGLFIALSPSGTTIVTARSGSISGNAIVTLSTTPPTQAGFGTTEMIIVAGLAVGALYMMTRPKTLPGQSEKELSERLKKKD